MTCEVYKIEDGTRAIRDRFTGNRLPQEEEATILAQIDLNKEGQQAEDDKDEE